MAVMMLIAGGLALAGAEAESPQPTTQPAQADANQPSAEHIAELVDDLENGKLKEEMSAYNELMEIGPPAIKPLLKMGRASRSRVTRVRVLMMLREIVKRAKEKPAPQKVDEKKFSWTEPVAGISMRLSVDRDTAAPGQLVRLRVDFRNVLKKAVPFAPLTRINLPRSSSWKVEGVLRLDQKDRKPRRTTTRPYEARPLEMQLKPGQTVTYRFRLNEQLGAQYKIMLMHDLVNNQRAGLPMAKVTSVDLVLPEGESKLKFTYYAAGRGLLKGATIDLVATVPVTVKKPEKPRPDESPGEDSDG